MIQSGRDAQRTGAWDQALAHYSAALQMLVSPSDAAVRADVLRSIAMVHRERGDLDRVDPILEESRSIAEAAGLADKVAAALVHQAGIQLLRGRLEHASALYLEAREVAVGIEEERMIAMIDLNLGVVANIQGNVAVALLSYRSALDRYRKFGDDVHATTALNNLGMAHVDLAEWNAAESCFNEAAEIANRTGNAVWIGRVELNRAELHLKRRNFTAAQESCETSLRVFNRLRTKPSIAEAYKFYGILFRETGRMDQADTHFALSLGLAEACQNLLLQAETQLEWALLHLTDQRQAEGVLYLNRALRNFETLRAKREVLDIGRRLSRLEELYLPAVDKWASELSERNDPFQVGHSQRVAEYATKLAREVGISGAELATLRTGALLHDLGNSAIPAEVLSKQDALDDTEREIMQVHTLVGEGMVREFGFAEEVHPYVRSHHEQWAGGGYPDNLAGDQIPRGVRILSIADAFDAIRSPRSFRPASSEGEAIKILEQESGQMFDPGLVSVFRDIVLRGEAAV